MGVGSKIKTLVESKQISIADLIAGAEISQSYMYELLRDDKKNPSLMVTKKIADFLGITVDELIK